ncbi:hypothetical protein BH23ACT3_BH23ACT3_02530 [soil metagenome]
MADALDTGADAPDGSSDGVSPDAGQPVVAHSHAHVHGGDELITSPTVRRGLWIAVAVVGVLTIIGVGLLWPGERSGATDPLGLDADPIPADVITSDVVPCSYDPLLVCRLVGFELQGGEEEGLIRAMEMSIDNRVGVGDGIYVLSYGGAEGELNYVFYEFQRGTPMLLLLVLFVAAVLLLGRWRGVGAIAGLMASLGVIVLFTLPSLLSGNDPVFVALVTASVIAFLALFLAHGFGISTAVALLSTFISLALIVLLGWVFVLATNLTGYADDSSLLLVGLGAGLDARGIVLAGLVIGSLGVLDDVTVTQVSAVWELKRARPDLTTADLYRPVVRIGRDHISSTVNTLFLAYAGAALPLLLLFTEAAQSVTGVLTREVIAVEVVRALVGSIGLVASVPISTYMAARVLTTE